MTDTILDKIKAAVLQGRILQLKYEEILAEAKDPKRPVVTIEVNLDLSSIYQVVGVAQGGNVFALLPQSLLPAAAVHLSKVIFTLNADEKPKKIDTVEIIIAMGEPNSSSFDGVSWSLAQIGAKPLSIGLKTVSITIDDPTEDKRKLKGTVSGDADIGPLHLTVDGEYPKGCITVSQPDKTTLLLSDFFSNFGLQTQTFLNKLSLQNLKIINEVGAKSGSVAGVLKTPNDDPLVLLDVDGVPLLSLSGLSLQSAYAPGKTDVAMQGQFVVMSGLVFQTTAAYHSDGAWAFAGWLDVTATYEAIGKPSQDDLKLDTLADICVPGSGKNLPAAFAQLGVKVLSVSYTLAKDSEDNDYTIIGEVDGQWTIGGTDDPLTADLRVELSNTSKKFVSGFSLHGFDFTLSVDVKAEKTLIDASIHTVVNRQDLQISGSYDTAKSELEVKLDTDINLAMMIAWFVGSVTGQRFYVVPDPWNDIFKKIAIPKGVAVAMNTKTKQVSITYAVNHQFLAYEIKSFKLAYDPAAKKAGKSGISMLLTGTLPDVATKPWDPATETPPEIPGMGASVLQVKTAAAGQHFAFDQQPTGVEDAVAKVGASLAAGKWDKVPEGMKFSQDAGWLFATQAIILGQADLQFIFNDPDIYGVLITVKKGENEKLNVLDGLYAEVLYRKVSDAVGVYEGTLILPKSIREINFGAFEMTLPKFYLAIYTNGDFKIDVGFPYDFDFSNSLSLTVEIYSGSAGFYYAKLDGLDPKSLPAIADDKHGIFNPVTEIGIGLQLGIEKGFESGPLTAKFSLMLRGLFQGTFATYHDLTSQRTDEFYDVHAQVEVFGQLIGQIDFVIIKAALDVKVFVRVGVHLIAHQPTEIAFSAGVSVELTVVINLFLFKVHIHLSFKMTVHGATTFGEETQALWQSDKKMLFADASARAAGPPVWQAIVPSNGPVPLSVYVLPALTAGANYEDAKAPDPAWIYVAQLGLSNPVTTATTEKFANAGDPSYASFVEWALRWGLYAASGKAVSDGTIDQATVDDTTVTKADITGLINAIAAGQGPDISAVRALFKTSFTTTIGKPPKPGAGEALGVGFFPALPGITVTVDAGATGPMTLQQSQLEDGSAQPPMALSHVKGVTREAAPVAANTPESVLVDYTALALRSGLQKAADLSEFKEQPEIKIADIIAEVSGDLASISGMTSRFMLHGTRQKIKGGGIQPLYAMTGQQAMISKADKAQSTLALSLNFSKTDQADWNVSMEGEAVTYSSADAAPLIKAPAELPEQPELPDPKPDVVEAQNFEMQDVHYSLSNGITVDDTQQSLWRLPPALKTFIASGQATPLTLYEVNADDVTAKGKPIPAQQYAWALSLELDVSLIPLPDAVDPKEAAYLKNTYLVSSVNQKGLAMLEALLDDLQNEKQIITSLSLGYRDADAKPGTPSQITIAPVDFANTFLVQSNFSTETRPPPAMLAAGLSSPPDAAEALLFLGKLWSAGVTASGGYFLFANGPDGNGLPEELFNGSTRTTVSIVVGLSQGAESGQAVPPYTNALIADGLTATGGLSPYYVSAEDHKEAQTLVPPGHMVIEVTRTPPADPTDISTSLDQAFNLYATRIHTIDGKKTADPEGAVIGPLKPPAGVTDMYYRHSFPMVIAPSQLAAQSASPNLPDAKNPYRYVGSTYEIDLKRVDLFGNIWDRFDNGKKLVSFYYDPLTSLSQLPYLTLNYTFSGTNAAPALVVNSVFKAPVYIKDGDKNTAAIDRKNADLAAYAAAYYQLSTAAGRDQVTATLSTSLVPQTALAVDVKTIAANLKSAYVAISKTDILPKPSGKPPSETALRPISAELDPQKLSPDLTVPLRVDLTIARKDHIAPDIPDPSKVRSIAMSLSPQMDQVTSKKGVKPLSLEGFNSNFNKAFGQADRRLAVGANKAADGSNQDRQIWVVRYGKTGICPSFDTSNLAYFAPRPISRDLISTDVTAPGLKDDGTLEQGAQTLTYRDVDLDGEMQRVMRAIDALFAPKFAIPAALVNIAALNKLSEAKKGIVEKLVAFVTPLQEPEGSDDPKDMKTRLEAAKDRYRQECLIDLNNFYEMVSVATLDLKTSLADQSPQKPLYVFGQPVDADAKSETSKLYSLTSGKAKMAPAGEPMAIGLFAKNKTINRTYKANLDFALSAIQHDVAPFKVGGQTYQVGGWLSFIQPADQISVGEVSIPIPLRAFPTPPELSTLTAASLYDADKPYATPQAALAAAKSWALKGAYQHAYVAQDSIEVAIEINPHSGPDMLFAAQPSVIEAILTFTGLVPALERMFETQKLGAIRSPEDANNPTLKNALSSFADLVDAIAQADWSTLQAVGKMAVSPGGLVPRSRTYRVKDGVQADKKSWASSVTISAKGSPDLDLLPQQQINGYDTKLSHSDGDTVTYTYVNQDTGKPLDAETAMTLTDRSIVAAPIDTNGKFGAKLNVIDRQSGNMSMQILRNQDFPEAFHYRTQAVKYTSPVAPMIDIASPIDVSAIAGSGPKPLKAILDALYAELIAGSGTDETVNGTLQLVASFSYDITSTGSGAVDLEPVRLPILMQIPVAIVLGPKPKQMPKFLDDIQVAVERWLKENSLSPSERPELWKTASISFDVALYSDASKTGATLVRLGALKVQCADITMK